MNRTRRKSDISKPLGFVILIVMIVITAVMQFGNFDLRTRATSVPANITVDASAPLPDTVSGEFMRAFAQGGEEKLNMLAPAVSKIAALKPKVIRIDHVYDFFVTADRSGGTLSYDFSRLDGVVRSILDTGAVPMLSLGYMPGELSDDGTVTGKPRNWQEWTDLVRQTVGRYSGKGGLNVAGIYYEVWNEPDLEQFGSWKTYGGKNYLDLYRYALAGAQTAPDANQLYIGGPAISGMYKAWIEALTGSGLRMDFFSWHSYNPDPGETAGEIQEFRRLVSDKPQYSNSGILITESGFTSSKDKRYGTGWAAAYSSALLRRLMDKPPAYIFSFEIQDGPDDTTDGWGMLTHQSKGLNPKPRYDFFSMLAKFSGQQLKVRGEGTHVTCIAAVSGNQIRLLLTNYRHDRENTENTPVRITGLKNGRYRIEKSYLSGPKQTTSISVTDGAAEFPVIMPDKSVVFVNIGREI